MVPRTRVELAQAYAHYPLKVACLPISPPGHFSLENTFKTANERCFTRFLKGLAKVKNLLFHTRDFLLIF
jgi:hypothetical protein